MIFSCREIVVKGSGVLVFGIRTHLKDEFVIRRKGWKSVNCYVLTLRSN